MSSLVCVLLGSTWLNLRWSRKFRASHQFSENLLCWLGMENPENVFCRFDPSDMCANYIVAYK